MSADDRFTCRTCGRRIGPPPEGADPEDKGKHDNTRHPETQRKERSA